MRVISKTTKGKKERIALAATEKAKVWTSVCKRYLTVEKVNPKYFLRAAAEEGVSSMPARMDDVFCTGKVG